MTDHDRKMLTLYRAWQALDDLAEAQASTLEKTRRAREAAWAEFRYAERSERPEVLR